MTSASSSIDVAVDLGELRDRARAWLDTHVPRLGDQESGDMPIAAAKGLLAEMHDQGLSGLSWPVEYGGAGLDASAQAVVDEECRNYQLPTLAHVGTYFVAPTMLQLATDDQKRRYLRPILRGEEVWCELFSEPGAGSDLASVRATAVRDGDRWCVNGQKVWTSGAHRSDFGLLLARTDPALPKHAGLGVFLVDLHQAGVEVRPLRQMTGNSNFNEVFLDDVSVDHDAMLAGPGGGWKVARTTLAFERAGIASRGGKRPGVVDSGDLRVLTSRSSHALARDSLARVYTLERVVSFMAQRARTGSGIDPAAYASLMKIINSRHHRQSAELAGRLLGASVQAWTTQHDPVVAETGYAITNAPQYAIAGGTTEVLLNLIGERGLGLPREPDPARGTPFEEAI